MTTSWSEKTLSRRANGPRNCVMSGSHARTATYTASRSKAKRTSVFTRAGTFSNGKTSQNSSKGRAFDQADSSNRPSSTIFSSGAIR